MNSVEVFHIVIIGFFLLPSVFTIFITMLPWPGHVALRMFLAIASGWIISILYTALIYNPAGIAAATSLGVDSPEMRYDNNTIATMVLAGWMYPTLALIIFLTVRWLWSKRKKPIARV